MDGHLTDATFFQDKNTQQSRIRRSLSQPGENHLQKPTAHTVPWGETLKTFSPSPGTRCGCPLSPLLLDTVLEASTLPKQLGKRKKRRHPNWKGSILFADDVTVCWENPKKPARTCQSIGINRVEQSFRLQNHTKFSWVSINREQSQMKFRKSYICNSIKKNKILENTFNKMSAKCGHWQNVAKRSWGRA